MTVVQFTVCLTLYVLTVNCHTYSLARVIFHVLDSQVPRICAELNSFRLLKAAENSSF